MLVHKAVRHVVLAQARRTMRILFQAGYTASAAEIGKTADCLQFDAGSRDETDSDATERNGRSFVVRVVDQGEVKFQKQVPAALFTFYGQNPKKLTATGKDIAQEANAVAARTLFREVHAARIGVAAMDAPTEAVLAGENLAALTVKESLTPRAVWVGLAALCMLAFLFSVWQGTRSFNFIDMTYLIENLNQLAQGRIPYRDFFLVLPPLHYLLYLAPFQFSGGSILSLVYSGAVVQVLAVLATFWVCQALVRSPWLNLLFAAIPAVMGMAMLGQPIYDCDAILAATLAIGALLRAERSEGNNVWAWGFAAGVAVGCSIMIKINIGIPLLFGIVLVLGVGRLLFVQFPLKCAVAVLLGVTIVLCLVGIWLANHGALGPMFEQVIAFAAKTRLHPLKNLILSLPLPRRLGDVHYYAWVVMLALLWILVGFRWFAGSHRYPLSMLLPIILMAVCLGTMQSQAYGSVYGLGPVAALTLAMGLQFCSKLFCRRGTWAIAGLSVIFIGTAILHDVRQVRLQFMRELLTQPSPFSETHLRGIRGYAPTVRDFEDAVTWAKTYIAPGDSVYWWPGTAPFYLATGFANPLANFQVYADTGLSPVEAVAQLSNKRVQWVFVDRTAPSIEAFGKFYEIAATFNQYYQPINHLGNVFVYRLKVE